MKKDQVSNNNQTHLCLRCGRKLKSEKSKQVGMGDTCYAKFMKEDNHKKLFSPLLSPDKSV